MKKVLMLVMVAGLMLVAGQAQASLVYYAGTGHWYDYVYTTDGDNVMSWDASKTEAESKGGYLATLTSSAENTFVWDSFYTNQQTDITVYKLGGYQIQPSTNEPGGGWTWVTGETWDFENWGSYDPNDGNSSHNQDWLAFSDGLNNSLGQWYDIEQLRMSSEGYIIEYNTNPNSNPVPEPATMVLMGSGLLGMMGFRKRKIA